MRIAAAVLVALTPALAVLYNVDQPVPISLAHGEYYIGARLWGQSGLMMRFGVGLFDRLTLGMSYGGNKILGNEDPEWYRRAEFLARIAIVSEQGLVPNVIAGFESQGYDDTTSTGFITDPRGGYLCAGKTISFSRTFLQLGVSYWRGMDAFAAVNQLLPGGVELIAEYDPALNNPDDEGTGLFNVGLGWTMNEKFRILLGLRDILGNRDETKLNRILELSVVEHF